MERLNDANIAVDQSNPENVISAVLRDADKVEAERERARAMRRQQRNTVLLRPYNRAIARMREMYFNKSPVTFGEVADLDAVGNLFLDSMSEMMIHSPAMIVRHEDIVGSMMGPVSKMCGMPLDQAKYLIERFIDLISNREDNSRPFDERSWDFSKEVNGYERVRYIVFESVGSETGWRLAEDGMLLTLRIFNTDIDGGNINHDLLERAFERKNIDDILYNLNRHKVASRRQSTLIQSCVRDIRMRTYLNWDHVGDPILQGRLMVAKQDESTKVFYDNISKLLGDDSIQEQQRVRLYKAYETLSDIANATRSLNITILDSEKDVREALVAGITVMSGRSMLPDMFAEVLVPMVNLSGQKAADFCDLVADIFTAPQPIRPIFDPDGFLENLSRLQGEIGDEVEEIEDGSEEPFVDLDSMDFVARKEVKDIFIQLVEHRPLLSSFIREVLTDDAIREKIKLPLIFQALAPPAGYRADPTGETYHISGFLSGDDLLIVKEKEL